jgi:hypothetical protein
MEKLKEMKECLTSIVEGQVYGNLEKVDTKELGEAIDMIKDLAEAIYYCTITEAMEKDSSGKEGKSNHHGMMYYSPDKMYERYPIEYYDPRYRERYNYDTMYAQEGGNMGSSSNGGSAGSRYYHDGKVRYPESVNHIYRDGMMKDPHEGRSVEHRKMYMSGKGVKDKTSQMKELENYMQELTGDITEMIEDASPEEKSLLQ